MLDLPEPAKTLEIPHNSVGADADFTVHHSGGASIRSHRNANSSVRPSHGPFSLLHKLLSATGGWPARSQRSLDRRTIRSYSRCSSWLSRYQRHLVRVLKVGYLLRKHSTPPSSGLHVSSILAGTSSGMHLDCCPYPI